MFISIRMKLKEKVGWIEEKKRVRVLLIDQRFGYLCFLANLTKMNIILVYDTRHALFIF